MDSFRLANQVRLSISQALLLLYRYLTGIYALGDLSFIQFLGGYLRGRDRNLDGARILTVSGNGIGELEKALCLQWQMESLETMAVTPVQMRVMRFLTDSSPEEIAQFLQWAQDSLKDYPNLQTLLGSPGLIAYWQQQHQFWQAPKLRSRVRLFGGLPWNLPAEGTYDAVLLSHAQKLLFARDAKELLPLLRPGGVLAAMMPVTFRPDLLQGPLPYRFIDLPAVATACERIRAEARLAGYELLSGPPPVIHWALRPRDLAHVVAFSIASPLRSRLIGELLIQTLAADLPEMVRLQLLESALADIPLGEGAGTEALLILLTEKGEAQ